MKSILIVNIGEARACSEASRHICWLCTQNQSRSMGIKRYESRWSNNKLMHQKKITYVPGLYKIFDEVLVNAADHKQTNPNMSYIAVDIDKEKGCVSVKNDGRGIEIQVHKKYNVYVPELIFETLLTSSNYNVKCLILLQPLFSIVFDVD